MATEIIFQSHYDAITQLAKEPPGNVSINLSSKEKTSVSIPQVILSSENELIYPFSHRYISEMLTEERTRELFSRTEIVPIFIDAQTGSGKTHFVFHTLYSITHSLNKKILYLASRSALKTKAKYEAIAAAIPSDSR